MFLLLARFWKPLEVGAPENVEFKYIESQYYGLNFYILVISDKAQGT